MATPIRYTNSILLGSITRIAKQYAMFQSIDSVLKAWQEFSHYTIADTQRIREWLFIAVHDIMTTSTSLGFTMSETLHDATGITLILNASTSAFTAHLYCEGHAKMSPLSINCETMPLVCPEFVGQQFAEMCNTYLHTIAEDIKNETAQAQASHD